MLCINAMFAERVKKNRLNLTDKKFSPVRVQANCTAIITPQNQAQPVCFLLRPCHNYTGCAFTV